MAWRKTYKYKLSTFSRAHGVVRKNLNDDFTLGSMQKLNHRQRESCRLHLEEVQSYLNYNVGKIF